LLIARKVYLKYLEEIRAYSTDAFRLAHLRTHTVEWTNADWKDEAVTFTIEIVENVQDKPLAWGHERG